jgi:hypothetical protein
VYNQTFNKNIDLPSWSHFGEGNVRVSDTGLSKLAPLPKEILEGEVQEVRDWESVAELVSILPKFQGVDRE